MPPFLFSFILNDFAAFEKLISLKISNFFVERPSGQTLYPLRRQISLCAWNRGQGADSCQKTPRTGGRGTDSPPERRRRQLCFRHRLSRPVLLEKTEPPPADGSKRFRYNISVLFCSTKILLFYQISGLASAGKALGYVSPSRSASQLSFAFSTRSG